mgnify:CR=1 FL=1
MSDPKPTGIYMLKWLDAYGRGTGGNHPYQYDLPKDGKPGNWHSIKNKKPIKTCVNGFHCTTLESYKFYSDYGPRLFIVEVAGSFDCHEDEQKVAFKHIRIIRELPVKGIKTYHPEIDHKRKVDMPANVAHRIICGNSGIVGRDSFAVI